MYYTIELGKMDPTIILDYWFPDDNFQKFWFSGKYQKNIDQEIYKKFNDYFEKCINNKLDDWKVKSFEHKFAYILLMDQFSRNIFRYCGETDNDIMNECYNKALNMSKELVKTDKINKIKFCHLVFVLMPFRHSNDLHDRKYVIDFIKKYEKIVKIKNNKFFDKFKRASINGYEKLKKK